MTSLMRVDEEVARWRFEVLLKETPWNIAFTNPTAGPWKLLVGTRADGSLGEVHRFEREETRPDLVVYSDSLGIIVILEAKDSLAKLLVPIQVTKSAAVVQSLARILKSKGGNEFWGNRSEYLIVAGLLWSSERRTTPIERERVHRSYLSAMEPGLVLGIVGIEVFREPGTRMLHCFGGCTSTDVSADPALLETVVTSMGLERA